MCNDLGLLINKLLLDQIQRKHQTKVPNAKIIEHILIFEK